LPTLPTLPLMLPTTIPTRAPLLPTTLAMSSPARRNLTRAAEPHFQRERGPPVRNRACRSLRQKDDGTAPTWRSRVSSDSEDAKSSASEEDAVCDSGRYPGPKVSTRWLVETWKAARRRRARPRRTCFATAAAPRAKFWASLEVASPQWQNRSSNDHEETPPHLYLLLSLSCSFSASFLAVVRVDSRRVQRVIFKPHWATLRRGGSLGDQSFGAAKKDREHGRPS
jgi:hypothetical protein